MTISAAAPRRWPGFVPAVRNVLISFIGCELGYALVVGLRTILGVTGPLGEFLAAWFFVSVLYVPVAQMLMFVAWLAARMAFPLRVPFSAPAAVLLGLSTGACLGALVVYTNVL